MELRQIRYFITLAEQKNFTRAANILYIAQPTLSQQIAELERELDVKLLSREKRSLELTPAGEAFLKEANLLMTQYEKCKLSVEPYSSGYSGHINFMTLPSVEVTFYPQFGALFHNKYPNITVHHMTNTVKNMEQQIKDRTADIALIISPEGKQRKHIVSDCINTDRLVLAVSVNSPFKHIQSFEDPEIENILKQKGVFWSGWDNEFFMEFLDHYTKNLHYICHEDVITILTEVLGLRGYTVLPEVYLNSFHSAFHIIPFPEPIGNLDVCLLHHKQNASPCVNLFLREALEYIKG